MNEVLIEAFRQKDWAMKALIAACKNCSVEELTQPAAGFGSILATLNHLVSADARYVASVGGGRAVWETAVAADALQLTQQLNPDVIIMGLNLPDMDGFSAAQKLRKVDPTCAIILLTIRTQAQDVQKAKAAGAIALIETSAGIDPILSILSSISSDDVEGK